MAILSAHFEYRQGDRAVFLLSQLTISVEINDLTSIIYSKQTGYLLCAVDAETEIVCLSITAFKNYNLNLIKLMQKHDEGCSLGYRILNIIILLTLIRF